VDNHAVGCYLDDMRLLACLLLVLLAVPARALDDDAAADERDAVEAGRRLRAIDDAVQRDADRPATAGDEEPEPDEPVDEGAQEPRDPYDDEIAPPQPSRRDAGRTPPPAKPESYPRPLETGGSAARASDGKGAGRANAGGKRSAPKPSPLDVGD
jgi:hypothetical protein